MTTLENIEAAIAKIDSILLLDYITAHPDRDWETTP